jgi:ferredoxin, 2Fe-2S
MPKVTSVEPSGATHEVYADNNETVMERAVLDALPGFEGMCGGMLFCGTCHGDIDDSWNDRVAPPGRRSCIAAPQAPHARL